MSKKRVCQHMCAGFVYFTKEIIKRNKMVSWGWKEEKRCKRQRLKLQRSKYILFYMFNLGIKYIT